MSKIEPLRDKNEKPRKKWTRKKERKGEPEISVKSPRAGSMLKTDMLVAPWLSTKRNCPPALTPSVTGFVPTGVGVIAVPIGASTPEVWSTEYPDTVLEVELA